MSALRGFELSVFGSKLLVRLEIEFADRRLQELQQCRAELAKEPWQRANETVGRPATAGNTVMAVAGKLLN